MATPLKGGFRYSCFRAIVLTKWTPPAFGHPLKRGTTSPRPSPPGEGGELPLTPSQRGKPAGREGWDLKDKYD